MTRPTDWSALGLTSDPTPGDPDQVQDVYNLINSLATDYQTILDTINKVNGYADSGNLSGATADALKQQMNGRITNFVKSAQTAFSQAAPALQTYLNALNDHQTTADNLLTQAQNSGLKPDDATVKGWATSAKQAGTDLQSAEDTATKVIQNLPGPSDPLSPWQEFLQILGWIALLLILPAMIFGGVIALVEFVVNAILFVNALVQFAQGNLSIGGLLLALLGVIAPTTRGISIGDLVDLVKGMGSFAKTGFVNIRAGLSDFMDMMVNTKFTDLLSFDTLVKVGNFVLKGGVWVLNGLKDLPTTMITAGTAFATKLGELFVAGGLKIFTSLRTGSFLSLILPIDGLEVEKLGLLAGLRLGFVDRGFGITASPVTNLMELNKLALAGVKTGEFHFAGFGYLDVPRTSNLKIDVGRGLEATLPNLNTNFKLASLDAHLEAPQLSINNLVAGFAHDTLDIGTISMHTPSANFGLNKLELPDLRFPKELNNIGNGTIVAKMNDMSFVTVHEDKLPANIDVNSANISVPTLHTANVSIPTVHTADANVAAIHTANVSIPTLHNGNLDVSTIRTADVSIPSVHTTEANVAAIRTADISIPTLHNENLNLSTIHAADVSLPGLHAGDLNLPALGHLNVPDLGTSSMHVGNTSLHTSVPALHVGDLRTPDLRAVDLASNSVAKLPASDELPNLSAVAHTQMNIAETHGFSVTQTDSSLKINGTSLSAGHVEMAGADTTHVDVSADLGSVNPGSQLHTNLTLSTDSVHLASPDVNALHHLATTDGITNVHLNAVTGTPHLNAPQLEVPRLNQDPLNSTLPPEIRALQSNPEIPVHANDSGIRVNLAEAQVGMHEQVIGTPETSTAVPAVSSTGIDASAAHSAGTRGAHVQFAEPDLAGKPGLIDPNGEKLAVAWTDFKQAQNLYIEAKAGHDLQFQGAESQHGVAGPAFNGKAAQTGAQADALGKLDAATKDFSSATTQLHHLQTDALDLTLQEHSDLTASLLVNPRLVGGSRVGDRPIAVHPDTGETLVATRPLGGDHQLVVNFGANRAEYGEVVNVHTGQTEFGGSLTEIDAHGGFRIDAPGGGEFREYLPNGTLHSSGQVVTNVRGDTIGTVAIDHSGGLADFHTTSGENLTGLQIERAAGGGVILHELNQADGWRMWQFDATGRLNYEPKQLFDHTGNPTDGMHIAHDNGLGHFFNDNGTSDTFDYRPVNDGSGDVRLSIPGNHDVWQNYDSGGRLVGYGMPLQHVDGHGIGQLELDVRLTPQFHNATIVADDGTRAPQVHADVNGRTITITSPDGSISEISDLGGRASLVRADIRTTLDGNAAGTVHVDYAAGTANFRLPGDLITRSWDFAHDSAHAGFTLISADTVHTLVFGPASDLRTRLLTTRDPAGGLTNLHIHTDYTGGPNATTHSFVDDNGTTFGGVQVTRSNNGDFRVTDNNLGSYTHGSYIEFDGRFGMVSLQRTNFEDFGGLHVFEDHINVDANGDPQVEVRDGNGAVHPDFQALRDPNDGHFIVTNISTGHAHGSSAEFDGVSGAMHYQRLNLESGHGLNVYEDHINLTATGHPTVTVRDANDNVLGQFQATSYGDEHFMITDLRPGHTQDAYTEFHGLTGDIRTNRTNLEHFGDLHVHEDHVNLAADGSTRITIRDDNNAVIGNFQADRGANGHFQVTDTSPGHQPGSHAEFDGVVGTMNYRRTQLENFNNLHIFEDHLNPGADGHPQVNVRDGNGAVVDHFVMSTPAAGVVRLTDNRVGLTFGALAEFDHTTGAIRTRQIHLQDSSGLRVNEDHINLDANGHPTLTVTDAADVTVTRFTAVRTADGRGVVLTDSAAEHLGETRTFNLDGRLTGAHIAVKNAKGVSTGDHLDVTFTEANGTWTGRWTRVDVAARDPRLPKAYNGSGTAVIKKDGSLVLTGADKTSLFTRERLTIGQELEVLKFPNGKRQWTSWDDAGQLSDSGFRRFANDDGGVEAKDVNAVGLTIRQYRTGIDGGLVRGEKMPDGTFNWTRFDKDGMPKLTGDRSRPALGAFGWKDTFQAGAETRPAQEHWSAFNLTTHAGHFREYGISGDLRTGFGLKPTFKEISQQGKDTGSLEAIANNHTLQFTRYSEQRVPDFLWKWKPSKYGTIDFPHRGFWTGDSRFQVYSWVEKDAHGVDAGHGVRVVTPDGSTFDYAGDGLLVRSVVKLDNGNKIEIGRAADGKWDTFHLDPAQPGVRPSDTLPWRELRGDGTVAQFGTRTFAPDKTWIDTFSRNGNDYVARYTTDTGDVVHFTSDYKPRFDANQPRGTQFSTHGAGGMFPSITRNTMGQIVVRTDHFDGRGAGDIVGTGDPRAGDWHWTDPHTGTDGIRVSGRNTPLKGSWDDSFADFEAHGGVNFQIRDYRALDEGTSLRGWRAADGTWQSAKFDAKGEIDAASMATREWKNSHGFYQALPEGAKTPKMADWQDIRMVNGNRFVLRASIDGKVRIYGDPAAHGTDVWKEYDFGSVWRQRDALTESHPGVDVNGNAITVNGTYFVEKESFQKQWRMTTPAGELIRYRGISGTIMERNAFGQWKLVGVERETKGLIPQLNEFRGWNRLIREPNRMEFTNADGAVGEFQGTWTRIGQKTVFDFLQDYFIDVAANIIITGATQGWNFNGGELGTFFAGAAIRSGVKAGYGIATETVLKNFRDGLRNIDSGKDWNRQPYNNDKFWDNEWAGNENPTRWRSGTFDYFVGNTFVPALGSFFATLVTGSTFGVGKDGTVLSGGSLWEAAGLSMAGNLVGGLTFGAIKTLGHVGLSGRWFHQGGIPDITLQFGEKMAIDWLVNDFLTHADGLGPGHVAAIVAAGQQNANGNTGGGGTVPAGGTGTLG